MAKIQIVYYSLLSFSLVKTEKSLQLGWPSSHRVSTGVALVSRPSSFLSSLGKAGIAGYVSITTLHQTHWRLGILVADRALEIQRLFDSSGKLAWYVLLRNDLNHCKFVFKDYIPIF